MRELTKYGVGQDQLKHSLRLKTNIMFLNGHKVMNLIKRMCFMNVMRLKMLEKIRYSPGIKNP